MGSLVVRPASQTQVGRSRRIRRDSQMYPPEEFDDAGGGGGGVERTLSAKSESHTDGPAIHHAAWPKWATRRSALKSRGHKKERWMAVHFYQDCNLARFPIRAPGLGFALRGFSDLQCTQNS